MEFSEKLQQLRKQKNLTQEELAAALFVSRAAVSKWESGRGYPGIDSLKAIAKYFSVSVDLLLSGEELLTLAEADTREKESRLRERAFGLLDLGTGLLAVLPCFALRSGEAVEAVSLLGLGGIAPWLRGLFFAAVAASVLWGLLTLCCPRCRKLSFLSPALNAAGVLLFILSLQPYAASFLFVFLLIKGFLLTKESSFRRKRGGE